MFDVLESVFGVKKPIIGMIHLAGRDRHDRTARALWELEVYQRGGVNGAIVEDYHGTPSDVFHVARESQRAGLTIVRGLNVLRDPYAGFSQGTRFGARFTQFDSVGEGLDTMQYDRLRKEYPGMVVLGGVGFKYQPSIKRPLEQELEKAKTRCEVIVTTGDGTGIETPLEKLREYKRHLGTFPLFVGAGLTAANARAQLEVADGAIVGSYFKPNGNTSLVVDPVRVRDLMQQVIELRSLVSG